MTISRADLSTEVKYFGAKIGEAFKLIGYVDVNHVVGESKTLVFHANLTQRNLDDADVVGKIAEEIQALAQAEADSILAYEGTNKVIDDYITLYNLGLYGVGGGV